jgi:hypothetical protein
MKNFKDNQKVRHPKYGEGEINLHHLGNKYSINFGDIQTLWKEIGDDFYNQLEQVEDLPNVSEYCYLWDNNSDEAVYAKFDYKIKAANDFKYKREGRMVFYQNVSKTPPFQ